MHTPEITAPEVLDLVVTDISRGGAGVAKDAEGRVVFVPLTAPGDKVRVKVISQKKNFAQGELIEILEPSPIRVKAPCPVFGRCGGCQWQHLPYDLQWRTKSTGVKHSLERVQIISPGGFEEFPADHPFHYRNRIQIRGEGEKVGYFAPRSHDLIPIDGCPIAREEINHEWKDVQKEGAKRPHPFKVEIEVFPDGKVEQSWNRPHAASGFRQVNDEQNEKLKKWIGKTLRGKTRLYDLYGGAGNLSLPFTDQFPEIHCVDVSSPDASPLGTPAHFQFHRAGVLPWILKRSRRIKPGANEAFSSAIVDPPRVGLYHDVAGIAEALKSLNVKELIAVGCDPDSWARDLSRWAKHGFRLERVATFDFFPQTPHIESVGFLQLH